MPGRVVWGLALGAIILLSCRLSGADRDATPSAEEQAEELKLDLLLMCVAEVRGLPNARGLAIGGFLADQTIRFHTLPSSEKIRICCQLLQHLQRLQDPAHQPDKRPLLNVPLPMGVSGISGMSSKMIQDPLLRQEYEQRVADNHRYARAFSRQTRLIRAIDQVKGELLAEWIVAQHMTPREKAEIVQRHLPDENSQRLLLEELTASQLRYRVEHGRLVEIPPGTSERRGETVENKGGSLEFKD